MSQEEWDIVRLVMDAVSKPEIYNGSDLEQCSGQSLPRETIENLAARFQVQEEPPVRLGKSDVQTLLAVFQNLTDSRVDLSSVGDNEKAYIIENKMMDYSVAHIFEDAP